VQNVSHVGGPDRWTGNNAAFDLVSKLTRGRRIPLGRGRCASCDRELTNAQAGIATDSRIATILCNHHENNPRKANVGYVCSNGRTSLRGASGR
jgi:hypothetical protein